MHSRPFLKSLFRVAGSPFTFHSNQVVVWFTSGNGKCNINFWCNSQRGCFEGMVHILWFIRFNIKESYGNLTRNFILVDRILFIQACMFSVVCCRSCQKQVVWIILYWDDMKHHLIIRLLVYYALLTSKHRVLNICFVTKFIFHLLFHHFTIEASFRISNVDQRDLRIDLWNWFGFRHCCDTVETLWF